VLPLTCHHSSKLQAEMANIQSIFSVLPLKTIEEVEHLEMLLDKKMWTMLNIS
jgi:hypothetical protein